jgi:hypothetical protein
MLSVNKSSLFKCFGTLKYSIEAQVLPCTSVESSTAVHLVNV